MSDIREMLKLAARAMEYTVHDGRHYSITVPTLWISPKDSPLKFSWSPNHNSGDAAEMCAALGIDTFWRDGFVRCDAVEFEDDIVEHYDEHNDRAAAWRMAALRVAAAIGAEHE